MMPLISINSTNVGLCYTHRRRILGVFGNLRGKGNMWGSLRRFAPQTSPQVHPITAILRDPNLENL